MLCDLYLSDPCATCYDNEGDDGGRDDESRTDDTAQTDDLAAGEDRPGGERGDRDAGQRTFTQEEVNKFLADDRRKHLKKYETLETSYQQLLENQSLSKEERKKLEESLENLRAQYRTKEQQAAHERKKLEEEYQERLGEVEKRAELWQNRYTDSTIDRSLQDAAVAHESFSPSQIVTLLKPQTKMVEKTGEKGQGLGEFAPMVDFPDRDPDTGEPVMTRRTPEDAVKRMKELPELYGNLFKSGVVSGIGGNSATGGLAPGANGQIDVRKLSPTQYREIREKNPELLGLKSKRGR